MRESDAAFPVLLELARTGLNDEPVAALMPDGTAGEAALGANGPTAWAPCTALGLEHIATVHFRNESELREHEARTYENIVEGPPRRVTPEVFEGGDIDLEPWLTALQPPDGPSEDSFRETDRRTGALALTASALPPDPAALEAYGQLISGTRARKAAATQALPAWLASIVGTATKQAADRDTRIAKAVWQVVRDIVPTKKWRPAEIYAAVVSALAEAAPEVAETLTERADSFQAVLRGDIEFDPQPTEAAPLDALEIVLLRPSPGRLLPWLESAPLQPAVKTAAAAIAGALAGRKQLPTEYRPEALDTVLATYELDLLQLPDPLYSSTIGKPKITERDGQKPELVLSLNDTQVLTKVMTETPLKTRLLDAALEPQSEEHALAARLCNKLDWSDCITTVITGSAASVHPAREGSVEVRITDAGPVRHDLDVEKFKQRLRAEQIPEGILEAG